MSFEREQQHANASATSVSHDDIAPGRSNRAANLMSPTSPLISGLIHRKARDENGVAGDAQHHVDRAAESTGSSLPGELRTKFESSLGHDLGHVRIHTGAESAAAADAVGARAYATGNDIHFNQGEYDPHSADGQRLIAHEVVHTVQQQGSAPSRQNKLEVSSVGDAHEIEADNLAEEMVAARPATKAVSRKAISSVSRGIHRWAASEKYGFRRRSDLEWCKDNPADPWNHGPNDYVAVGSGMPPTSPSAPADVGEMWAGKFPEPLNGLSTDGKPYDLPPGRTVDKANEAIDALHVVMTNVVTTHNGMAAAVRDYTTAADQVKPDGLFGPAPAGLNWAKPKDGGPADAGQLLDKQVPTGSKTAVGDVFDKDNKVSGVSDKAVTGAKQQAVSQLLEAARGKDLVVGDKLKDYRHHITGNIVKAIHGVQNAYTNLKKKEENDKADKAGEKKEDLELEKKEAIELITTCGKVVESGSKVLEGEVPAARELILLAAEKVVSHQFDKEIKEQQAKIREAKAKIRSLDQSLVENAIKDAQIDLQTAIDDLEGKRQAVVTALKERQDAYDLAAAEAKKQAIAHGVDPKEAERMQAVIMAIPRIGIVMTKCKNIVDQAAVPAYNATAGLAYAVGRNGNQGIDAPAFERAIGAIKYNRDHYTTEQTKWQQRLDSAKQVEAGLNVPSSGAK